MVAEPNRRGQTASGDELDGLAGELRIAVTRTARRMRVEGSGDAITSGQYSILAALKSGPATLGALAGRERVQPPSMSRSVGALVERGLLERTEDSQDRRVVLVGITDAGRQVLADSRSRRTQWLAQRLADLDPSEREVLAAATRILARISGQ